MTFDDEIKFFENKLSEFLQDDTLKGKYVAILDQQIIASGSDRAKLMEQVYTDVGYKPILFKKVTNEKRVLRLRSPKIHARGTIEVTKEQFDRLYACSIIGVDCEKCEDRGMCVKLGVLKVGDLIEIVGDDE